MSSDRELRIRYAGDASALKSTLGQIESANRSLGSRLASIGKTVGKGALIGAAAGTVALLGVGKAAVSAAQEAERVGAQTAAVLDSTGSAANVTAQHVGDLANQIMEYSGISDEAVQSSENVLLTFTNVANGVGAGNDVFDQATTAVANLSTSMGKDLNSSAILVGKALNNPIAGLSALTRVGVAFTDQQKEQITALVESGKTMDAQKLILAELTKEFGGSAEALGQTTTGQFNTLKEEVGNALEDVGGSLLEVGQKVLPQVGQAVAQILGKIGPTLGEFFGALATTLADLLPAVAPVLAHLGQALGKLLKVLGPVLGQVIKALAPVMDELGKALVDILTALLPLLPPLAKLIGALAPLLPLIAKLVAAVVELLVPALNAIIKVVTEVVKWIVNLAVHWRTGWQAIKKVASAVFGAVAKVIGGILKGLVTYWTTEWNVVKTVALTIWNGLKAAAGVVWSAIETVIVDPIRAVKDVVIGVFQAVRESLRSIWNGLKSIASAVWNAIAGAVRGAVNLAIDAINALIRGMNKVSGGLDWVAGPWLNWGEVPEIPHLANGGMMRQAGLALVGERGPEVLALPRGASVIPMESARGRLLLRARLDVRIDRRMLGRAQEVDALTSGW